MTGERWFDSQESNWFFIQTISIYLDGVWFEVTFFYICTRLPSVCLPILAVSCIFMKCMKYSCSKRNKIWLIYLGALTLNSTRLNSHFIHFLLFFFSCSFSLCDVRQFDDINRFSQNSSNKIKKKNSVIKLCQSKVIAVCLVLVYRRVIAENSSTMCKSSSMQPPPCALMKNSNWHWLSM